MLIDQHADGSILAEIQARLPGNIRARHESPCRSTVTAVGSGKRLRRETDYLPYTRS
jgi:hypothetical protein